MSRDMHACDPGAHMWLQASTRQMFDEEVPTYHSSASSKTHGPVRRGHPNIFGGQGRYLPTRPSFGASLSPSMTMGPPKLIPLQKVQLAANLALLRTQDQAAQQAMPSGVLVLPLGSAFAQANGLQMGISMPPPVGPSQSPQGDSATQPAVQAAPTVHGADMESSQSLAGSASDLWRWAPPPQMRPHRTTLERPSGGWSSDSSSLAHYLDGSQKEHNPHRHSKCPCSQR